MSWRSTRRAASVAPYGDGQAAASGSGTFTGTASVSVSSTIRDLCPADGYGAYLTMDVVFMDGSRTQRSLNEDTNGCGNGSILRSAGYGFGKNVRAVQLVLFEYDAGRGIVGDSDVSTLKDNPRT